MKRIILLAYLLVATPVAAKPACDQLAGSVIFQDMMYGALAGAVLSGLYIAAADHHHDQGKLIAGTTLGTAGIGVGVGIMELAFRNCPDTSMKLQSQSRRVNPTIIVDNDTVGGGLTFRW